MLKHIKFLLAFCAVVGAVEAKAANPAQVAFSGDADCGISSDKTYTHAISFGNDSANYNPWVNGVQFHSPGTANNNGAWGTMPGTSFGWSMTPTQTPYNGSTGNIALSAINGVYKILCGFNYGNQNAAGEISLSGLTPGKSYEFRLYERAWDLAADKHRVVTLTFDPAGSADALTFDPDDAKVEQYVSYRYVADAGGIFKMSHLAADKGSSLHIYAVTNEELPGVDGVEIVGSPEGVGEAAPPFGWLDGVAAGSNFIASASAVWTNVAGNVTAAAVGWESFTNNAAGAAFPVRSGSGASFNYTHLDAAGKIVWHFAASNLICAAAGVGGSVSSSGGWFEFGSAESLEIGAAPDGSEFYIWTGDVPAGMERDNPLFLPCDRPRSVMAHFNNAMHVAMEADGGNDANDGISFESPKLTIAAAVAAVAEEGIGNGIVLVAPGEYGVEAEVALGGAVTVRGASGVAEDVVVFRGASANTRVFNINHADARLEFLTVSGGNVTGNDSSGGNIYIGAAGGTVADCVVRNGRAASSHQQHGGNISLNGAGALVTRCVITNGAAYNNGGGGGVSMGAGRVENCFIAYNNDGGGWLGSAVKMRGASVLENCTIVRNAGGGGGAVNPDHASAIVRNCVIVDNEAPNSSDPAGSVFRDFATQATRFENCVADVFINAKCVTGENGFGFADAAAHDYRLTPLAVALDAGAAKTAGSSETDLEGNARVVGAAIDAGCHEYQRNGAEGGAFDFAFDTGAVRRHAAPFDVVFTAAVLNAQGEVTYTWDFGDGTAPTNTTSATIRHTYAAPGTNTVSVTATDSGTPPATATRARADFIYAAPGVIHVAQDSKTAAFPYGTFETALATLQAANAIAEDGTTIIVHKGDYWVTTPHPTVLYRNEGLYLDKAVVIRGATGRPEDVRLRGAWRGYALLLNNKSARVENVTVRDGDGYWIRGGGNIRIDAQGGAVSNCVITAGTQGHDDGSGSGVYLGGADALVTHCVITNNSDHSIGSSNEKGVVKMAAGRVEHSLIAQNKGSANGGANDRGSGGVWMSGGTVFNCVIADNASRQQGAIYASGGIVTNCVITGNKSAFAGAVRLAGSGSGALLTHCVITDNQADISGQFNTNNSVTTEVDGARTIIRMENGRIENSFIARGRETGEHESRGATVFEISGGVVRHSTIADNTAPARGVLSFIGDAGVFTNCVIAGNASALIAEGDCRVYDSTSDEPGLDASCRVASASVIFNDIAIGNYNLGASSPAIDAGRRVTDAEAAAAGLDLQGRARIIGNRIDDGCYEHLGRGTMILAR